MLTKLRSSGSARNVGGWEYVFPPLPGKQSYPAHGVRTLKSRYRMKTKPSGAICRIKIKYLFEERGCH